MIKFDRMLEMMRKLPDTVAGHYLLSEKEAHELATVLQRKPESEFMFHAGAAIVGSVENLLSDSDSMRDLKQTAVDFYRAIIAGNFNYCFADTPGLSAGFASQVALAELELEIRASPILSAPTVSRRIRSLAIDSPPEYAPLSRLYVRLDAKGGARPASSESEVVSTFLAVARMQDAARRLVARYKTRRGRPTARGEVLAAAVNSMARQFDVQWRLPSNATLAGLLPRGGDEDWSGYPLVAAAISLRPMIQSRARALIAAQSRAGLIRKSDQRSALQRIAALDRISFRSFSDAMRRLEA